ncbi:MAG TPA: hypothetical protein PLO44_01540 [Candidatus Paceibacterota bacterium]|nr:hypothetical protein [Candidatus Paceibacterota bacterium]
MDEELNEFKEEETDFNGEDLNDDLFEDDSSFENIEGGEDEEETDDNYNSEY